MPALVQHFTPLATGYGGATPLTIAYSGVTPGNGIMVMALELGVGVTFGACTDGTNSYVNKLNFLPGSAAGTTATWLALNITTTSGTISVTFTGGPGGNMYLFAWEVSNVTDYDAGNADANYTSGPADAGGFTLTHTNDLVILVLIGHHTQTFSDPVGYTIIDNLNDSYWYRSYQKAVTGGGAQTPTSTMVGGPANWLMAGGGIYGSASSSNGNPIDGIFFGMT